MNFSLQPIRFVNAFVPMWIAFLWLGFVGFSGITSADEFQLSLDGGSVITVVVEDQTIQWTDVQANGDMVKKPVALKDIQKLYLSFAPASKQVSEIRRLLSLLASQDYLEREIAERKLSDPDIGGRFKTLIKAQQEHEKFEVRYRLNRILDDLDTDAEEVNNEFDKITLTDGTVMEGDAGEFELTCTYRGRETSFSRSDIRLITAFSESRSVDVKSVETVAVEMFHDYQGEFYLPGQTTVDFEKSPSGSELSRRDTDVSEMYAADGLLLGAEKEDSFVGISGYKFKFPGLPPRENSVCVVEMIGTYPKHFKGVMEVRFCLPNQKSVPAGVHEVGLFLARVTHSRDFIVEAYNADGQVLATVESTDQHCVFAGLKSTEPITRLRILSNPYLFRVDRSIDEDYAIDSVCFSPPVAVPVPQSAPPGVVQLRNGDLLTGSKISILDSDAVSLEIADGTQVVVERDEIHALRFDTQLAGRSNTKWFAMLPDRSTIYVTAGETFTCEMFKALEFAPDELLALWSSQNPARFPAAGDFAKGKTVMVFPTCRIASDEVRFTRNGFDWSRAPTKIEQELVSDGGEEEEEDPTPTNTDVEFSKTGSENIPTLWTHAPQPRQAGTGLLRLTDGQQFVLSGQAGFEVTELGTDSLTLVVGEQSTKIPLNRVLSIEFPAIKPAQLPMP